MPDDQLQGVIDAIRTRLQAELDAQLSGISQQHQAALDAARRDAEAEAEQRWASKVDAVRAEWSSRLESEVQAARGEAERRMVAESMRLRAEAEQAAAESAARARDELEQAVAIERERAQEQIDAERQRAERELEAERDRLRAEAPPARSELVTDAQAAERQSQLAAIERLLESVRSINGGRSLSDTLTAVVAAAGSEASRAALLIVSGHELQVFAQRGFGHSLTPGSRVPAADGMLGESLRRGEAVASAADPRLRPPDFASLSAQRAAIAVPIAVGEQVVALLYADDEGESAPEVPAAWPEAVQILGRHAGACLAYLTAVRTAQALGFVSAATQPEAAEGVSADEENGARRYAKLLVSEIKLYNEGAVRVGRQQRDLLRRLRAEIERAQRLYEERVPPSLASRTAYFQQELVQTLADGDPALLGG